MSFDPNLPPEEPAAAAPPPLEEAPLAPAGVTEGSGLPRNIAAVLACIFLLPGGIAFYFLDRRDRFVRFYALQAIVLSVVFLVIDLGLAMTGGILGMFPFVGRLFHAIFSLFFGIVYVGFLILWLLLIWNSYRGVLYEMPFLWKLAKRHIPTALL